MPNTATIRLTVDPVTGKRTVTVAYTSDADMLPHEHEEAHRGIVEKLFEGGVAKPGDTIVVEREGTTHTEDAPAAATPADEKVPEPRVSVFRFESEEALRFSITSSLVPRAVLERGARTWRDGDAIVVAPEGAFPAEASKALVAAGVTRLANSASSDEAREVGTWAELVPLAARKDADFDPESAVLFFIAEGASLVALAGELLRLGCDRLEYRVVPDGHLLRANAPPYYSVLRALDGGTGKHEGIDAYVAEPPGQERVWLAIGYEHALLRFVRPEGAVLVGPNGWRMVPDGTWNDIYALVDVEIPATRTKRKPSADPPRINVPLRLARAATIDAPSLWIIREDAAAKMERLAAGLPEEMLRALLFAALSGKNGLTVVVRLRAGQTTSLEIDGEAYRAHPSIANLFLPIAATLEPPLRRDRLRDLLTPDPDDVVWLRAREGGAFKVESAPDAAFQPITEWVEYVIDTDRDEWLPWVRSATFDFQSYVGAAPRGRKAEEESAPELPAPKRDESHPAPREAPARPVVPAPQPRPAPAPLRAAVVDTSRVAEELAKVEQTFFALEAPADAPPRMALWSRMAVLDTMLARTNDAALCWTRVIWENGEDVTARSAWAEGEKGPTTPTLLALVDPTRDHVRTVAARLVAGTESALPTIVHDVSRWLDKHDAHLDVRAAWLARLALAQAVGGDRLGLARSRDRILARIHSGLSLERDVPSFLRRAGRSRDVAQIEILAQRLDRLVDAFAVKERRRTATEAEVKLTGAYVRFVVAFGLARLGRIERARQVRDEAVAALPPNDPIHGVLVRAYVARIGHALEGLPPETPLPAEISALINGLAKLDRYKVDRVRQASKVLEPHERLDPIAAFQRGEADPRGPEFAALRGEADPAKIEALVADIVALGIKADPVSKARLFDGAMDFFPAIRQERAHAHLATILANTADIPPPKRVQVLDEALMLAGHFGEEALARQILAVLEPLVANVGAEGASAIAPVASGMLRTLRRFGLRDEAERMLAALQIAAKGPGTPSLIARLYTAAALAFLGRPERALPVFDEAFKALPEITAMTERLQLGRALAKALGAAPLEYALSGLERLEAGVVNVTDSFNTNTHVCLSVLDFMEALVLGYASDDLAIDPEARRHLDDDEYLVRRRIHRDTTP